MSECGTFFNPLCPKELNPTVQEKYLLLLYVLSTLQDESVKPNGTTRISTLTLRSIYPTIQLKIVHKMEPLNSIGSRNILLRSIYFRRFLARIVSTRILAAVPVAVVRSAVVRAAVIEELARFVVVAHTVHF